MPVDLPITENSPARELAKWVPEDQLACAITYLELIKTKIIHPGPEIERLAGSDSFLILSRDDFEISAIQNRLAYALCIKRNQTSSVGLDGKPNFIRKMINQCVFKYRADVLASYNTRYDSRG